VFTQVGIPASGAGELFRQAYSGELDIDSVRSAAERYQVLTPVSTGQNEGLTEDERYTQQRIAGAGSSGIPPSAGQDPRELAIAEIMAIPYKLGDDPNERAQQVMAVVRRLETGHPEVGRFTNPNN